MVPTSSGLNSRPSAGFRRVKATNLGAMHAFVNWERWIQCREEGARHGRHASHNTTLTQRIDVISRS